MSLENLSLIRRISISAILVLLATVHIFDGSVVDGILPLIQDHFSINDSTTALAKTFSSISSTVSLALMLLYNQRFERRTLILLSVLCYGVFHGISLLSGHAQYWLFISTRTISSFTTSAFSVLMPVVLADFFSGRALGRVLMITAFIGMIGSLLSTSLASFFVTSTLPWQTSLAIGPFLSIALLPALFILFPKSSVLQRNNIRSYGFLRCFRLFSMYGLVITLTQILAEALTHTEIFNHLSRTYLLMVIGMSFGGFYVKASLFWMPSFLLSAWNYSPDVFGGIAFPTVITTKSMAELIGTLTGLPLLVWVAEKFHFGFLSFQGSSRSIPIVFAVSYLIGAASALAQIYIASHNYALLLATAFVNSFMGAPVMSLGNQMLLTVCPTEDRTSAIAMVSLITSVTTLPAEQIIGRISDAIRGNSELIQDRFFSLETALFINWTTCLMAGLVYSLVVFFYPFDELRVRMKENEENIEKNPLLPK